ncbi:MAG: hypothetical protein JW902_08255 [Syntrophaceae bacterium]|nr:hypothetical protein [Syntrophaceae bacterium]
MAKRTLFPNPLPIFPSSSLWFEGSAELPAVAKNKKAVGSYQPAHGLTLTCLKKSGTVKADLAAKAKKSEKSAYANLFFKPAEHQSIS